MIPKVADFRIRSPDRTSTLSEIAIQIRSDFASAARAAIRDRGPLRFASSAPRSHARVRGIDRVLAARRVGLEFFA
jgi:hypothetical protein